MSHLILRPIIIWSHGDKGGGGGWELNYGLGWGLDVIFLKNIDGVTGYIDVLPCTRPGPLKFELTNQHSANEKNFTVLTSQQLCAL